MFSRRRRLSQRQTSLRNGIKVFLLVRAGTALAMTAATAVERVICDLYQNGGTGKPAPNMLCSLRSRLSPWQSSDFFFLSPHSHLTWVVRDLRRPRQ